MTAPCKAGDRIRLLHMDNDPSPLPDGATGTVRSVTNLFDWQQIAVNWDAPNESRTLCLIHPDDKFEVIE